MNRHSLNSRVVSMYIIAKYAPTRILFTNIPTVKILFDFIDSLSFIIKRCSFSVSDSLKINFATISTFCDILEKVLNKNCLVTPFYIDMCLVFFLATSDYVARSIYYQGDDLLFQYIAHLNGAYIQQNHPDLQMFLLDMV